MKTVKVIAIAILSIIMSGCEKFLTHEHPTGVTDDIWWETETQARNALATVYWGVPDGFSGRGGMLRTSLTDEAVARQDHRGAYEIFTKGLHNDQWGVALHFWQDCYLNIRFANRFLEHADKVFMEQALLTRYKAEARALRAYYHMELLLLFGDIPIMTVAVNPNENDASRSPQEEVFDFIVSEFQLAAEDLPIEYSNQEAFRISKGACFAFISRLALFYHRYELARDMAKRVVDLNVFRLYRSPSNPSNSFAELFSYDGEINNERIMFRPNGNVEAWNVAAPFSIGGNGSLYPTSVVVDNFETRQGKTLEELGTDSAAIYSRYPNYNDNRDPRLKASVLMPGDEFSGVVLDPFNTDPNNPDRIGVQGSTATGFWVRKYLDTRDRFGSRQLYYMNIRYAEVLLNYVEALIELGEHSHPDVITHLNDIRNRAGMPDIDVQAYNSADALRKLVRRERMAELAFEGPRFYDIRRWGVLGEVMNGIVYGATNPATGNRVTVEERSQDPNRDFRYPIPQDEILANPNMVQNPGY
ncbi:RagB/SusD family nutrient uptake outer membrane protein [Olivibacter sp. SDN3]|uniref:RagB/SusD family nutrient uptake outer membrane protein n=1 Tax=Olivibacter sp. SDN3 TaxID=2764720 RepID=UPI0016518009|nr:RagB/SusD family nutrient uptake outer membrane protein [Olivibacter sp. SDN3]QNL49137.1 RagB/SusD family nutrient uptake outer membrane protein [Olivibacter sp. SDN3]